MQKKIYVSIIAATMVAASLIGISASAAMMPGRGMGRPMGSPGIFGKVSAVSGNTITVAAMARPKAAAGTATVYTVDASSATVTKNGAVSMVSAIAVGDMVGVQGTVTGTNVAAKTIQDGLGMPGKGEIRQPIIEGNGQPIVAGKITSISGNTVAITNASNVSYTVDASNAKILIGNQTSLLSNLAVGSQIVVQGAVNGNSVVASSIMGPRAPTQNQNSNPKPSMMGMFAGFGNFFKHMFGF